MNDRWLKRNNTFHSASVFAMQNRYKKRFISPDEPLIDRAASDTYLPIHVKDKQMHENEKRFEVV
jgi:hypothetical protein